MKREDRCSSRTCSCDVAGFSFWGGEEVIVVRLGFEIVFHGAGYSLE
jgi:hypothetical protein